LNLLLDTHVAIWALTEPERIPAAVLDLIARRTNKVHVSAASIWEISIKHASARQGRPPFSGFEAIRFFREADFELIAVTAEHAALAGSLPLIHADPFDRLVVAQALSEPMRLVTRDPKVAAYSDTVITW
jgi:PIN domain nuclease of toxin-antitoxin system